MSSQGRGCMYDTVVHVAHPTYGSPAARFPTTQYGMLTDKHQAHVEYLLEEQRWGPLRRKVGTAAMGSWVGGWLAGELATRALGEAQPAPGPPALDHGAGRGTCAYTPSIPITVDPLMSMECLHTWPTCKRPVVDIFPSPWQLCVTAV